MAVNGSSILSPVAASNDSQLSQTGRRRDAKDVVAIFWFDLIFINNLLINQIKRCLVNYKRHGPRNLLPKCPG